MSAMSTRPIGVSHKTLPQAPKILNPLLIGTQHLSGLMWLTDLSANLTLVTNFPSTTLTPLSNAPNINPYLSLPYISIPSIALDKRIAAMF